MQIQSHLIALDGNVSRPSPTKRIDRGAHRSLDYIVYDVWIFVELVTVYLLFPETGNMSLEQTAVCLDGINVKNALVKEVQEEVGKTPTDTVREKISEA